MNHITGKSKKHERAETDKRPTPQYVFDHLDREFHFDLDAAAGHEPELHKCDRYFTVEDDALQQDWNASSAVFLNPPYSNMRVWIEKAYEESVKHQVPVVLLVSAGTGLTWFGWAFERAAEIRFIIGHLSFRDDNKTAPFGSLLIVFHGERVAGSSARTSIIYRDSMKTV